MITDASLSGLLLDLYGAVGRREEWSAILARLCTFADASQAALVHHHVLDSKFLVAAASHGTNPEGMALYNDHYGRLDPWTRAFEERGGFKPGSCTVTTSEALVPNREFQRTEFCADFGVPFDMVKNVMVVTVPDDGESATTLTFPSGTSGREPSASVLHALRVVAPHLQQALLLAGVLAAAQRRTSDLMAAMDSLGEPMALLSPDGTVIFLNVEMRALTAAGQPLAIERRSLVFRSANANVALRRMLQGLSRWRDGLLATVPTGVPFASDTKSGRRTLTLSPMPAPDGSASYLVVARVLDPTAATERRISAKLAAWQLTPAEEKIARLLASGKTVAEIASATRTRQATVRWHLKQIFLKTGARTQAQVVADLHA